MAFSVVIFPYGLSNKKEYKTISLNLNCRKHDDLDEREKKVTVKFVSLKI